MRIQAPPGMRDFYPEDMRQQNWLLERWRSVARRFGFVEYEGPIFEFYDLYAAKSGPQILGELFRFRDRGGRALAIRPEMTPTLARMVAARAGALPRPIKWFSLPRMCRAEKPQRGRLREFFQWNVDILGVDDPLADAEVIAVAAAFLREVGLGPSDVAIRINSRPLAGAALEQLGIERGRAEQAFHLIDRFERLPPEQFRKQWDDAFGPRVSGAAIMALLRDTTRAQALEIAGRAGPDDATGVAAIRALWDRLGQLGVAEYCAFDLKVVRGLAYYTGIVFEAHAQKGDLRALLGGGRYDDLTGMLGGPRLPGVGFGMGDAPVLECLKELGKLPTLSEQLDVFLIDADESLFPKVLEIASRLRQSGLSVDFSYKRAAVSKQFKQAADRQAAYAVVVGAELAERGLLTVKDLRSGRQGGLASESFLNDPPAALRALETQR